MKWIILFLSGLISTIISIALLSDLSNPLNDKYWDYKNAIIIEKIPEPYRYKGQDKVRYYFKVCYDNCTISLVEQTVEDIYNVYEINSDYPIRVKKDPIHYSKYKDILIIALFISITIGTIGFIGGFIEEHKQYLK